jgi:hypothetical protein
VRVVQSSVTSDVISFILSFKRGLDQYWVGDVNLATV